MRLFAGQALQGALDLLAALPEKPEVLPALPGSAITCGGGGAQMQALGPGQQKPMGCHCIGHQGPLQRIMVVGARRQHAAIAGLGYLAPRI